MKILGGVSVLFLALSLFSNLSHACTDQNGNQIDCNFYLVFNSQGALQEVDQATNQGVDQTTLDILPGEKTAWVILANNYPNVTGTVTFNGNSPCKEGDDLSIYNTSSQSQPSNGECTIQTPPAGTTSPAVYSFTLEPSCGGAPLTGTIQVYF